MNYKVASIIVTYNRLECLKRCIDCLKNQTYKNNEIIVIDNASNDGTDKYCEGLEGIVYIRLGENNGGSYGFYYGVKYASGLDVDLIWGMDDDAYAHANALEKLIDVYRNGESIENTALWSDSMTHLHSDKSGIVENVRTWTFVGFMLSRKMISKVGFPRNDLFIFYDDNEYAKRIIRNNGSIKWVHDSIIIHEGALKINQKNQFISKSFLGMKVSLQKLPSWKWYYMIRNIIIIQHSVLYKFLAVGLGIRNGLKFLILQPENLSVCCMAIRDGIMGRTGKRICP